MGKAGFASISQVQVQLLIPSTSQSKMEPPVPSMTHSIYDRQRSAKCLPMLPQEVAPNLESGWLTESGHARQSRRKGLHVFSTECCQDRWHR